MKEPVVVNVKPNAVELEKGKEYYWCSCGQSKNQPFCDGSHRGTEFTPKAFTSEQSGTAYLCDCKHTANAPFCDGTHKKFTEADKGKSIALSSQAQRIEVLPTSEEPMVQAIHDLAENGLKKTGHHGEMTSMGVPLTSLPRWDDIQLLTAQLARKPLLDSVPVSTKVLIGPNAKKPLQLERPLFVSDMSFGALSQEAKLALAKGAELAGTGICSGEGGMLPAEQEANSRYFYELASAKFGYDEALLSKVQAFHFKAGQGAKTGTGGHLTANKVTAQIAEVRGLAEGTAAISPATFTDLHSASDFKAFADRVRELTGGIPIGMKLSANHIEADIAFALEASVDYLIIDGRGGGTGAAPVLFRDHISVPTIPALARARHYLDKRGRQDISLVVTGGLRTAPDFVKALALGADAIALSNSAMQAIGCVAARMCNSNNCPAGIATQKPELRARIDIEQSAQRLARFFEASTELMAVLARACGYDDLRHFNKADLTTFKRDMAELSGVEFGGFDAER